MNTNNRLNCALSLGLLLGASSIGAQTATVTTFDCPAASNTYASAINASGQVTGYCTDASGTHAFLKTGATITTFDGGTPNLSTGGNGINASGQVTGNHLDGLGLNNGFVYAGGVVTPFTILNINNLPTTYMVPRSINASGDIVGEYADVIDPTHGVYRGFIYHSTTQTSTTFDAVGTFNILNPTVPVAINDLGQITGSSGAQGFIYTAGVGTVFSATNATQTVPRSINNLGDVVGMFYDINNVAHGFINKGGIVTTYDIAGATTTDIWSINDIGQIAGYYLDSANVAHGFIQTGTVITTVDGPAAIETAVRSINASGQATGYYADSLGLLHGFVTGPISAVPPIKFAPVLPNGIVGTAYSATLAATGGTAPFTFTATGLPSGLTLVGNAISGKPIAAGTFAVQLTAVDATNASVSATVTVTIAAAPTTGNYTIPDEASGRITFVAPDHSYLMIGKKKLIWDATTQIQVNTNSVDLHVVTSFVKPGMEAQWKGLRDKATNTVLTRHLEIN